MDHDSTAAFKDTTKRLPPSQNATQEFPGVGSYSPEKYIQIGKSQMVSNIALINRKLSIKKNSVANPPEDNLNKVRTPRKSP
jgi:hypothetical protein